jgi:hypothetical protein
VGYYYTGSAAPPDFVDSITFAPTALFAASAMLFVHVAFVYFVKARQNRSRVGVVTLVRVGVVFVVTCRHCRHSRSRSQRAGVRVVVASC